MRSISRAANVGAGRLRHPATAVLAAAMAASGTLLVVLGSKLSFFLDDWVFILYRRAFDLEAFMGPDNEHFVAGPVAIWKAILAIFGMGSPVPFRIASTAMFLLGAWLAFVWIRRRLGEWPALLATIAVLFLGAAFDDFLWFASITFLGSMVGGMAMLVALDRQDRKGDAIACAGLVVSLLFSSLWLAFAAGAALDVFLGRRERPWLGRAFLVTIPVGIYVAWWLGWGHTAESAVSIHNLATTPLYVFDSLAAAIAALLGLAIPAPGLTDPNGLDWGRPLAVVLLVLAVWRMYRMPRIPRSLWVVIATTLAFWVLGGLDVKSGRVPDASRYQYPSAVFVLLIGAELLRGVPLTRRLLAPALAVLVAAVLANVVFLHQAYESYVATSQLERADLAAVEIARDTVEPDFFLEEETAGTGYDHVDAGSYLSARDAFGSPAYTEAQLTAAPLQPREAADRVLVAALRIGLQPAAAPPAGVSCRRLPISPTEPRALEVGPGETLLRASGTGIGIALSRFSPSFPAELGELPAREWAALTIPSDRSTRRWHLAIGGSGAVILCERSDAG